MPPRRRSKAPATFELPEPLWAEIASHLSLKDWAKVSSTCKTTFKLQPRTIDVPPASPPAGVIWAIKRLRSVEVLRLSASGASGLSTAGMQDSKSLMHLKQLEIITPSVEAYTTSFKMWFAWVLSHAKKLTLLSAVVGQLEWFPPMMQLKHLVLTCDRSPGKIFAALPHAESLQTLSLHAGTLSGGALVLEAPRLELGSLPSLQSVALHGVFPDHTNLPKECGLHLADLVTLDALGDEIWAAALTHLRSVHLERGDLVLPKLPDIFKDFQDWQNLTSVYLNVKKCGAADEPVSLANLAQVQQLFIGADREMYVTVPAKVSWQKLGLWGSERLEVSFEDMDAFAQTVKGCAFTSKILAGPCLWNLCLILAERCIPWESSEYNNGETELAFPTDGEIYFPDCFCGACMTCLQASGVAEECSNVPSGNQGDAVGGDSSDDDENQDDDEEEVEVDNEVNV